MHKSIPIWRDATALLLEVEQAVRHFPRYHKYTIFNHSTRSRVMSTVCLRYPKKILMCVFASIGFLSSGFYSINVQAANILSCDNENTSVTATTTHLTDNTDGTITDPETGLIWKKCSEGQTWGSAGNSCTDVANIESYNWLQASQRVQDVNAGTGQNFSQTDWRLPNIKELASIVELRCFTPAINNTVFPNTPASSFWSSSPYAPFSANAWSVFYSNGNDGVGDKSFIQHVRLVRSGQ